MAKPQVLVFIDWYKPFFKAGGPVRSMVNLVDHLHDRVEFHIVTGDRDYTALSPSGEIERDRWVELDRGERVHYGSPEQRTRPKWRALLKEREWDAVYINGVYSVWSSIVPLWLLRRSSQRRIVAVRGMLAGGAMRQSTLKKRAFLGAMKLLGCFRGVEFQATNTEEVEDIERWIDPDAIIHLVPNLGRKAVDGGPVPITKSTGSLRLVSVARIAEEKNTLFAIECLKGVQGSVRFDLFGAVYDPAYWQRCQEAIAMLGENVTVEWHDHIAQDEADTVLAASHVLFLPSAGENFGHAMLESLVAGRPMVISDGTPWKGLAEKRAGWDLPLERAGRFTDVVQGFVDMDQDTFNMWSSGAASLGMRYLNDPEPVEQNFRLFCP